jgi:hypothetical protein
MHGEAVAERHPARIGAVVAEDRRCGYMRSDDPDTERGRSRRCTLKRKQYTYDPFIVLMDCWIVYSPVDYCARLPS